MLSSESPLMMLVHAAILGAVLYVAMRYGLRQVSPVALTRSVFAALLVALYMIAFGHGLPKRMNPNLI